MPSRSGGRSRCGDRVGALAVIVAERVAREPDLASVRVVLGGLTYDPHGPAISVGARGCAPAAPRECGCGRRAEDAGKDEEPRGQEAAHDAPPERGRRASRPRCARRTRAPVLGTRRYPSEKAIVDHAFSPRLSSRLARPRAGRGTSQTVTHSTDGTRGRRAQPGGRGPLHEVKRGPRQAEPAVRGGSVQPALSLRPFDLRGSFCFRAPADHPVSPRRAPRSAPGEGAHLVAVGALSRALGRMPEPRKGEQNPLVVVALGVGPRALSSFGAVVGVALS